MAQAIQRRLMASGFQEIYLSQTLPDWLTDSLPTIIKALPERNYT